MRNRIKELRAINNLTQEKLAELVEVRRETIVFLEKGKYNPSLKLAHSIGMVFNLRIEEIFIFDDQIILDSKLYKSRID
ncbi:MAG: transcriptional regulator [Anaerolineales bacterium]|nr:MAG: transcriptional regulator [Anaerolineales bacterium]